MPLVRLVYFSIAREADGETADGSVPALLRQARRSNLELGVTGVLVSAGPHFIQALEGRRDVATALFGRILHDRRHSHVELVECTSIRTREFGDWSMAFHRFDESDQVAMRRFGRGGRFDPALLTAEAMRLFLIAMTRQSERAAALRAGF